MRDLDDLTNSSLLSNWTFTQFVKQTDLADLIPSPWPS